MTMIAGLFCSGPAFAQANKADRSIAVILDASGSMNAPLDGGRTRLDGAKAAVAALASGLGEAARVSLWAYGHQSGTDKRNCEDIEQIVVAGPAASARAEVSAKAAGLAARGYTPITATLTRAAEALAREEAASHVITLVSDGKETCSGDPCAAARALAKANVKLVVHAIGLGVDAATRGQLQCIASVTGGLYADAGNTAELTRALSAAATTERAGGPATSATTTLALPRPGRLVVKRSGGHRVLDAETGVERGFVSSGGDNGVDLPPGIYNVRFLHGALWRGVQVKSGETTTIAPGVLRVTPTFNNHSVLDAETEEELGFLATRDVREAVLIPGVYAVRFGAAKALVDVKPDAVTTYEAGAVRINGSFPGFIPLRTKAGEKVAEFHANTPALVVPPGAYVIDYPGTALDIEVKANQTVEVKLQ